MPHARRAPSNHQNRISCGHATRTRLRYFLIGVNMAEVSRFRSLNKPLHILTKLLLISLPVVGVFFIMDTPSYLGWDFLREQYYGIVLAIVLACVFLLVPPTKGAARNRVPWYDIILSILGFGVG